MGYIVEWLMVTIGPLFLITAGIAFLYTAITQTWDRRSSIILAVVFLVIGTPFTIWRFTQPFYGPFTYPFS
ncbi:hypothetical protein NicSoilC5_03380 [Arthrobacter sp. NicSoilC5]|nr:hypothetical protein NicSoilC5_03380 [Arthrobacter sp. NicSoilC5]